ncbi:MAG: FAD-dependent oxidoreductase [Gammaproteobacteria bacterium]|nr:FAD-dependent oxidoreductase [Gammaproteobacteria bacterium]
MNKSKVILITTLALIIGLFFLLGWDQYLNLDYIKSHQSEFEQNLTKSPWLTTITFFVAYVIITGASLPGAAILTLIAGALFGLVYGTLLVSFASTLGATLAFLSSRYLLRDKINKKFKQQLTTINQGIDNEGNFYLFGLRLVPIFPFFIVNLVMGVTSISTKRYFIVSQLGMLPGTLAFVFAGTQLGQVNDLSGLISAPLLAAFALLGVMPLLTKRLLDKLQANRIYRPYQRPKSFDYNLIVIGAGAGGLVSSYIGAAVNAKVALVEKHQMGGDCLNTGCVPSKALIKAAKFAHEVKKSEQLGFEQSTTTVNFAKIMARVHQVIKKIEPHDSVERYSKLGVDVKQATAHIVDPWTVEIDGKPFTTAQIIIATGARPFVPPISGLDQVNYLTSDNLWQLTELPQRLIVLGGGPIGSELTQAFARLGSQVSQVELFDRIMPREDPEVSEYIKQQFIDEGIDVLTNHQALRVEVTDGCQRLICQVQEREVAIEFDHILIAVGRSANTAGFGLEQLDITLRPNKTIAVNKYLQTNYPNIYAVGDVTGPYQFTHVAAHQAWYSAVNALFGRFKKFAVDYRVIPWATFVDPEVARVGLNETEAAEQGIDYCVTRYDIDDLDRAIADNQAKGWIKVITAGTTDKILGVTIVGHNASELLTEYVTAMKYNLGLNKILGTIHLYPTMSEANKYAAGVWKRNHAPQYILGLLKKYHNKVRS